jgi:hypothetical protein
MARNKATRSARSSHQPERRETKATGTNQPVVRFIPISSDDLARDPFRYVSNPPRLRGEPRDDDSERSGE